MAFASYGHVTRASANNVMLDERREMGRYVLYFHYKAVQIIVQSRLGKRVHRPCKINRTEADWVSRNTLKAGFRSGMDVDGYI